MNLYKDLPAYYDEDKKYINVVVEITKGSQNKVEYNEEDGFFDLDRVLHHSMFYPFDYGFVPGTAGGDGDAVDVVLLVTQPTFPGCRVRARVVGCLKTSDQDGVDHKLIAVPISKVDPRWDDVESVGDLGRHFQDELLVYFKEYKRLEKNKYDKIMIDGFGSIEESYEIIDEAIKEFKEKH